MIKIENEEVDLIPELVQVPGYTQNDLLDENTDDEIYKAEIDEFTDNHADECDGESESEEFTEKHEDKCDEESETEEDLRLVNKAKKVNGRFKCDLCEKTLADRRTFLLHIRLHLGKNLKHCDICARGFAKQNHLDRHKTTHFRENKVSEKSKRTRVKSSPKNSNQNRKNTLQNTVPKIHTASEEKPEDKKSIDEEESRLLNAAKEVNGRLQCPICPKTLSQRKVLRLHIRSHVGKNLLHCKICNRGFAKGQSKIRV